MQKVFYVITEPDKPKFIIPEDQYGNIIKKEVSGAEDYCKEEYGGRLARSSDLKDWKNIDSRFEVEKFSYSI